MAELLPGETMRTSINARAAAMLLAVASLSPLVAHGQTFAAMSGTEAVVTAAPENTSARVLTPGHHKKAEPNLLFGRVRDGVYTVDGLVAKVRLNYDVNGVSFLYLFAPGVGTAVISAESEPKAVVSSATLKENELSFTVGEHRFNLTGVALSTGKGSAPAHLNVRLDRAAWGLNRQPMIGFGDAAVMPYQWPGALTAAAPPAPESAEVLPPVPVTLLPSTKAVTPRAKVAGVDAAGDPSALQ
jgi:hypothetical protein